MKKQSWKSCKIPQVIPQAFVNISFCMGFSWITRCQKHRKTTTSQAKRWSSRERSPRQSWRNTESPGSSSGAVTVAMWQRPVQNCCFWIWNVCSFHIILLHTYRSWTIQCISFGYMIFSINWCDFGLPQGLVQWQLQNAVQFEEQLGKDEPSSKKNTS